jgi:SAM-dependent methyltransferase
MMAQGMRKQVVDSYEIIGEHHARALDSVYNDYNERPAIYALLGEVQGRRVLDAGCGPGHYAAWLVDQGATVLALDASPKMVQLARQRLGDGAQVRQADLNEPLDFLEAASFDLVLSTLALDYVRDWDWLFADFRRVLVEGGRLVFSVHHPFFLDLKVEADVEDRYFCTEQVEEDWRVFGLTIPAYRRPLGAMSSALWGAGFLIEQLIEPQPTEACRDVYPAYYEKLSKHPVFLCVAARARGCR